jgi:hypothetical protein
MGSRMRMQRAAEQAKAAAAIGAACRYSEAPAPLADFLRNPVAAKESGSLPLEPPGGKRWGGAW